VTAEFGLGRLLAMALDNHAMHIYAFVTIITPQVIYTNNGRLAITHVLSLTECIMNDNGVLHNSSAMYNCKSLNVPGLRLLGRGEDGDSAADRFRDVCCPGIASSASSIIKFCTENTANVLLK